MCIIAKNVQVAKKDIPVWKVLKNGKTPFKTQEGVSTRLGSPNGMTHEDVVSTRATGFNQGNGYTAFLSRLTANRYIIEIECCHKWDKIEPVKLIIPAGTNYAKGRISSGKFELGCKLIGAGLPAVRCESLKEA